MKRISLLSLIVGMLVTVSVMGTSTMQAEASGCSNWEIFNIGDTYCIDDGCGIIWHEEQTHIQYKNYKRTCVSNDGKVTTEHKSEVEKLGCC